MFGIFASKHKTVDETPFSHFIRSASSAEKKRVYMSAMRKANESQRRVIEAASHRSKVQDTKAAA